MRGFLRSTIVMKETLTMIMVAGTAPPFPAMVSGGQQ